MQVLDSLEEESRYEVLNGKVRMMSPVSTVHDGILQNLIIIFGTYLKGKSCRVFGDNVAVKFSEKNRPVPDMSIVCDPYKIKPTHIAGAPDMIVEILSPSTRMNDRSVKKDMYESHGVGEYWIVEPNSRTVEVYLLREGKYELNKIYTKCHDYELEAMDDKEKAAIFTLITPSMFADLVIDVADVFENVD